MFCQFLTLFFVLFVYCRKVIFLTCLFFVNKSTHWIFASWHCISVKVGHLVLVRLRLCFLNFFFFLLQMFHFKHNKMWIVIILKKWRGKKGQKLLLNRRWNDRTHVQQDAWCCNVFTNQFIQWSLWVILSYWSRSNYYDKSIPGCKFNPFSAEEKWTCSNCKRHRSSWVPQLLMVVCVVHAVHVVYASFRHHFVSTSFGWMGLVRADRKFRKTASAGSPGVNCILFCVHHFALTIWVTLLGFISPSAKTPTSRRHTSSWSFTSTMLTFHWSHLHQCFTDGGSIVRSLCEWWNCCCNHFLGKFLHFVVFGLNKFQSCLRVIKQLRLVLAM